MRPHLQKSFSIGGNAKGIVLIEALTFLFLFAVVSLAFFETYTAGTRLIIEAKNRLGATALANQKMEIVRSIDYDSIGTKHWTGSAWVYGVPAGDILEDETVTVNTRDYTVHTFVQYVDDTFDGTLSASTDAIPNDYKRVRLTVSWGAGGADQSIATFANFSPNGVETSAGGGVFSINVIDASGSGVSGATVRIYNAAESIDITTTTDSTGNITLPGTPAGVQNYELTVSKGGYYGAVTLPPYPTSAYAPVDEHASVADGVVNQKTVVIDLISDIVIHTKDPFGTDVPNINMTVKGGRVLGTYPDLSLEYGFSQTTSTDGSGNKTFADQSYGAYTFSVSDARYEMYKFSPEESTTTGFSVTAGSDKELTAVLLDSQIGSVRVLVQDQTNSMPIAGASVRLYNTTLGYDTTLTTDQYGYAYFPTTLPALIDGTYDIETTASGYNNDTSTAAVSGALVKTTVSLTPS